MSYTFPKSGRRIHDVVPYSFVAISKTGKETTRYMLKGKDEEGIEGLEPGGGNLPAKHGGPHGLVVGPGLHGVALLLVHRPEHAIERADDTEPNEGFPLSLVDRAPI